MSALIPAVVSIASVVAFALTQGPGGVLDPARGVVMPESIALNVLKQCTRTGVPASVTGSWTPAPADLQALEARLSVALKKALDELAPTARVPEYFRQYVGLVRADGRWTIYANAFHLSRLQTGATGGAKDPEAWRRSPVNVCDGGTGYFGAEYDVATAWLAPIHFNSNVGMVVPRFGSLASSLTADDLRQIRNLATRMGGEMWVVFGDPVLPLNDRWVVAAYLKPGIVTDTVRIARLAWAMADVGTDKSATRVWRIDSNAMAAQVPLAGRPPDAIISDGDANRPFRVAGEWSAEDLARLVAFIRSGPTLSNPKLGRAQVNGALPIDEVWRERDGTVRVSQRIGAGHWQVVELSRNGDTWTVTALRVVAS